MIINDDDKPEDGNWMFRCETVYGFYKGPEIHCYSYKVIKKTPKGKWIVPSSNFSISGNPFYPIDLDIVKKFVLDKGYKRYAHETREGAIQSFIARKNRHIAILETQLERAKAVFISAGGVAKLDQNDTSGNVIIEKIGMGTKPDPYKFSIEKLEHRNGNTIILAKYVGCTTFDGHKLMVLKGIHNNFITLDPHFFEDHPVVARFIPDSVGWDCAYVVADNL